MKKISILFCFLMGAFLSNAQCVIDTTQVPAGSFFAPAVFPCVEKTVAYNQTLQFKIPSVVNIQDFFPSPIPYTLYVDSLVIDSITGYPTGLADSTNPLNGHFYPGKGGCARVYGTTNDAPGNYPLTPHGIITLRGNPFPGVFDGDTTVSLDLLSSLGNSPFSLSLDVINQGAQCRPTGINNAKGFNAIIKTYPSPAHTTLNVDINTVDRINGSIQIVDMLGNKIYDEKIDLIGLMSKQINVSSFAKGMYTIQITDANKGFKTKFVVE